MPEELRVFVRAALYIGLVTAIYWFVSYEKAGTLLMGFLFGGAVLFVVVARSIGRPSGSQASFIAFDDEAAAPLEVEEEPVVTVSPWPVLAATGAMLIGLGLLYGPWLWIPGAGLALAAGHGWITQTDA